MALWEMIKKGAEEGLEALKEGVAVFVAEAEKKGRIIKKRVELSTVQNNVRRTFTRLGSGVYEIYTRGEKDVFAQPEVKSLIDQVEGSKARVREIEMEIEAIKKEEGARDPSPEPAAPGSGDPRAADAAPSSEKPAAPPPREGG
jgi:hypothetical protein